MEQGWQSRAVSYVQKNYGARLNAQSGAERNSLQMIHPTAIIGSGAYIGSDVEIGPYCIIENDVAIGAGTTLKSFVELRRGTRIGEHCYIDSGVKMSGDCVIGDRVTVRYDAIIARGCTVGNNTFVSPKVMTINLDYTGKSIGGAKIGCGCHIGTTAVLNAGIEIADNVVIGAMSLVTKSCLEPGKYWGVPAKLHGVST
jgi:UDP-N-acetylglucosamine acyltransferase